MAWKSVETWIFNTLGFSLLAIVARRHHQRHSQDNVEFFCPSDGNPRVHFALTTEHGCGRSIWGNVNRIVPDTGMYVEATTRLKIESGKIFRTHVVANWRRKISHKWACLGEEHLPAIWMIV